MNKNQMTVPMSPAGCRRSKLQLLKPLALVTLCLAAGCMSKPVPVPVAAFVPPPAPQPIDFDRTGTKPLDSRWDAHSQAIIEEANRVWASHSVDSAAYLRSARLIRSVLESEAYSTPEEQVRLATIALQHGLRANDAETLRSAAKHWEAGYRGSRKAPQAGEVETYLFALRRLGQDLPEELVGIANPEIQTVLKTES